MTVNPEEHSSTPTSTAAAVASIDSSGEVGYGSIDPTADVEAAESKLLPAGQTQIILHLGFKPDNQLDYGGRHITIATFIGMRNSNSSHKEMTVRRLARWINVTSRCDENLINLTKRPWRLNTTTCSNTKATSCSCLGKGTNGSIQCGDLPWTAP
jgi:hypothetical protein